MSGNEWVHERLEIRSPPLTQRIANDPLIIDAFARELASHRGKTLVQPLLEALGLLIVRLQVVPRKLEEGIGDLQHENVGMVVFVAHEHALAGAAHAKLRIVILQTTQARRHRRVFLRLCFLRAKRIVAERVKPDGGRLVCVERFWDDRPAAKSWLVVVERLEEREDSRLCALQRGLGYRRHDL